MVDKSSRSFANLCDDLSTMATKKKNRRRGRQKEKGEW